MSYFFPNNFSCEASSFHHCIFVMARPEVHFPALNSKPTSEVWKPHTDPVKGEAKHLSRMRQCQSPVGTNVILVSTMELKFTLDRKIQGPILSNPAMQPQGKGTDITLKRPLWMSHLDASHTLLAWLHSMLENWIGLGCNPKHSYSKSHIWTNMHKIAL